MSGLLAKLGLTEEAKLARMSALGGSDANTIMGGNADRILALWREKRSERKPDDLSDNLAVQMGSYTEALNIAWFEKQTGMDVHSAGEVAQHPDIGFMRCTLDGRVQDAFGTVGVFEAKHVGTRSTDAELFERYVPQLTHNCLCAGTRSAWLSAFKGNGDWVMFEYALDDAYAAALIEAETAFWACVQSGEPPVALPAPPAPKPVGVKVYDMAQSNAWAVHAAVYHETVLAADRHELARKELKALVPDDASKCFGGGITINRDKRGALRFATGE